jgi:hypothetical protein
MSWNGRSILRRTVESLRQVQQSLLVACKEFLQQLRCTCASTAKPFWLNWSYLSSQVRCWCTCVSLEDENEEK